MCRRFKRITIRIGIIGTKKAGRRGKTREVKPVFVAATTKYFEIEAIGMIL